MAQTSRYIEAPYNGVSQAPPQVRPTDMAEAIENVYLDVPQGGIKRPPFLWQGRLGNHPGSTNGLFELIDRAGASDVFLSLTNEYGKVVPRVYPASSFPRGYEPEGLAPEPLTITPAAQAYLDAGGPSPVRDLVALTVEDTTFILNRKALVGKQAGTAPARPKEAIVWVRQAAYARVFTITVTPSTGTAVTASLRTPNGKDASDAKFVDTEVIAGQLANGGAYTTTNEATTTGSLSTLTQQGFTVQLIGPVIYLSAPDGVDFTVDVSDGQGGIAMLALKDKAQRFADLPQKAVAGFTLRITQQSGTDQDDYFVRYEAAAGKGSGVWVETIAPGAELGLDPATMPVGLVFDGGWQVRTLAWKPRTVGDQSIAKDPDFVGTYLADLTFWRGRLAIVSGSAVSLSSAIDPLRFYPSTLATITDADAVALVSPLPGKGTFARAAAFDSRLIVFSDEGQAAVQAQGVVRPDTVSIDVAGAYEYSGPLRPRAIGERLYFLAPRSEQASVVYELEGGQDSEGKYRLSGDDLTAAVPRYIPAGIDRAADCSVNYLVVYAKSGDRYLYPHLFRYADRKKEQNAISRWSLPEGYAVGGALFSNTRLYLLACYEGEAHLVMADLAPGQLDPGSSRLLTHLDFRVTSGQMRRAFSGITTVVSLPYPLPFGATVQASVAAPGDGDDPEGLLCDTALGMGMRDFTLSGSWETAPLFAGFRYSASITLSTFYALGSDNRPLRSGRLSVRRVVVDVARTGYLRSEVLIGHRLPKIAEFTGLNLDNPDSALDQVPSVTSKFSFGVGGENESTTIALINDSHLGSNILGLEWRGELNLKAGGR